MTEKLKDHWIEIKKMTFWDGPRQNFSDVKESNPPMKKGSVQLVTKKTLY
jgi:hypothetical protein